MKASLPSSCLQEQHYYYTCDNTHVRFKRVQVVGSLRKYCLQSTISIKYKVLQSQERILGYEMYVPLLACVAAALFAGTAYPFGPQHRHKTWIAIALMCDADHLLASCLFSSTTCQSAETMCLMQVDQGSVKASAAPISIKK